MTIVSNFLISIFSQSVFLETCYFGIKFLHTYHFFSINSRHHSALYFTQLYKLSCFQIFATPIIPLDKLLANTNATLLSLQYRRHFIIYLPQLWTAVNPFCHSFSLLKSPKKKHVLITDLIWQLEVTLQNCIQIF